MDICCFCLPGVHAVPLLVTVSKFSFGEPPNSHCPLKQFGEVYSTHRFQEWTCDPDLVNQSTIAMGSGWACDPSFSMTFAGNLKKEKFTFPEVAKQVGF